LLRDIVDEVLVLVAYNVAWRIVLADNIPTRSFYTYDQHRSIFQSSWNIKSHPERRQATRKKGKATLTILVRTIRPATANTRRIAPNQLREVSRRLAESRLAPIIQLSLETPRVNRRTSIRVAGCEVLASGPAL